MKNRVITVDAHYTLPQRAAIYLYPLGNQIIIIDTNTTHAIPYIQSAMKDNGLSFKQVSHILITHVHLDHCAGIHALLALCPHATVLAHPRAIRHLLDPTILIESTISVYGIEMFNRLFGSVQGIPPQRVQAIEDKHCLELEDGQLIFYHCEGHARHHFCVYEPYTKNLFAGDIFGLSYPALQTKGKPRLIYPSSPPPQFDPLAAKKSIYRILNTGAQRIYLTHFGSLSDVEESATSLLGSLDFFAEIIQEHLLKKNSLLNDKQKLQDQVASQIRKYLFEKAENDSVLLNTDQKKLMEFDIDLNTLGICHNIQKRRGI